MNNIFARFKDMLNSGKYSDLMPSIGSGSQLLPEIGRTKRVIGPDVWRGNQVPSLRDYIMGPQPVRRVGVVDNTGMPIIPGDQPALPPLDKYNPAPINPPRDVIGINPRPMPVAGGPENPIRYPFTGQSPAPVQTPVNRKAPIQQPTDSYKLMPMIPKQGMTPAPTIQTRYDEFMKRKNGKLPAGPQGRMQMPFNYNKY